MAFKFSFIYNRRKKSKYSEELTRAKVKNFWRSSVGFRLDAGSNATAEISWQSAAIGTCSGVPSALMSKLSRPMWRRNKSLSVITAFSVVSSSGLYRICLVVNPASWSRKKSCLSRGVYRFDCASSENCFDVKQVGFWVVTAIQWHRKMSGKWKISKWRIHPRS